MALRYGLRTYVRVSFILIAFDDNAACTKLFVMLQAPRHSTPDGFLPKPGLQLRADRVRPAVMLFRGMEDDDAYRGLRLQLGRRRPKALDAEDSLSQESAMVDDDNIWFQWSGTPMGFGQTGSGEDLDL